MTIQEMKLKIAEDVKAWRSKMELEKAGYDEETAIVWVYSIWFE